MGVPSPLITLPVDLEEYSGSRVGRTAVGAYAAHTRASTPGMSISKRLAAVERTVGCELSSSPKA